MAHPAVQPSLDGLTVLQIADLHVRRPVGERSAIGELIGGVAQTPVDLVLLNGDYMHHPGHEHRALEVLERLIERLDARLGVYGVFGNHDSGRFREQATKLDGVRWLLNQSVLPCEGLRLVGASFPGDFASAGARWRAREKRACSRTVPLSERTDRRE